MRGGRIAMITGGLRRGGVIAAAALLGATLLGPVGGAATEARALSGSQFQAGLIISDGLFYDGAAMTEPQIQQFLASKGSGLAGYTFTVASRSAVWSKATGRLRCGAFQGGTLIPAAQIIYNAQVACGISAKVILVTLQKEQGLVTKATPTQGAMDRAMGYACPDTAPCAPTTLGFGNQVYAGALQLNTYKADQFGRQPGLNSIQYSPDASCGSSVVNIRNYATAALYNYTPYQPDAAALANLGGTGDRCSSYGNRNFWVYYNTWFGDSLGLSPVPLSGPSLGGTVLVGSTVTVQPGIWSGSPTFTYAWMTCSVIPSTFAAGVPVGCTALPGMTSTSYASTATDIGRYLAVAVTGTNSHGSLTTGVSMSAHIGVPVNTAAPTVAGGYRVGATWTVDVGTWVGSPAPTIAIYWLRCSSPQSAAFTTVPAGCSAIAGATSATYVATDADLGSYLTAQVAGNAPRGFGLAGAISTLPIGFPQNTRAPTVSGSPVVGAAWAVDTGTWTGSPTPELRIFWLRCSAPIAAPFTTVPPNCSAIPGANSATYVVTMNDAGSYLTAQVSGNSSRGFALAGAIGTAKIAPPTSEVPVNTVPPTVTGSGAVGGTWTVTAGTWTGSPPPTLLIFWLRCDHAIVTPFTTVPSGCAAIPGANSASYVTTAADAGFYLTAQVSGNNTHGFGLAGAVSNTRVALAASSAPTNVTPPVVSGVATVGATWSVDTGTWSGSPAPTILVYWLRCTHPITPGSTTVPVGCAAIPGARASSYTATVADVGDYITAQVAANGPTSFALAVAVESVAIRAQSPATAPANVVAPTVRGAAPIGSTWTVRTGIWTGAPVPAVAVFWLRCTRPMTTAFTTVPAGCSAIAGANSLNYRSTAADAGAYLTAQVAGNGRNSFTLAGATNSLQVAAS
jgi:hypothetical protein